MSSHPASWDEICMRGDIAQAAERMREATQKELDYALGEAAWRGKLDLVELLLARANPKARLDKGSTALMKAASGPGWKCVHALLKASDADARTDYGETATMKAAVGANPKALSLLLTPERALERDDKGWAPIAHAVYGGSEKCFALLAPLSDMSARAADGRTLLSLAIQFARSIPLVEALATPEALLLKDADGWTPAQQAKIQGQRKIHKILLARETAFAERETLEQVAPEPAAQPSKVRI